MYFFICKIHMHIQICIYIRIFFQIKGTTKLKDIIILVLLQLRIQQQTIFKQGKALL